MENAGTGETGIARPWLWRTLLGLGILALAVWWNAGRKEPDVVPRDLPQIPVVGRVTVQGKPLERGKLQYMPDRTQGTTHMNRPSATIAADGTYELKTWGRPGAPAGRYRVVLMATKTPLPPFPAPDSWIPDWAHAVKYSSYETTTLTAEVAEDFPPGAYDFDLEP